MKRKNKWGGVIKWPELILNGLTHSLAFLSAILILVMAIVICVSVIMRYYLNLSVGWSTELSEYMIYLSVLLGVAWVLKQDKHVTMDALVNVLKVRNQIILAVISNSISAIGSLVLFFYGAFATYENYLKGTATVKVMSLPKYLLLFLIPLMSILCFVFFVKKVKLNYLNMSKNFQEVPEKEITGSM